MNWYYAHGDQRQGPVSESDFDALIAAGTITESTLVWKEGMPNWAPLREVRTAGAAEGSAPEGWIRCTATGRYFPPEEIVYLDGKPYSAAAKPEVLQGVARTGALPVSEIGRNGPPWENRAQLGFFVALFQTIKGVLFEPAHTFETMRREGGIGSPLLYYIALGTVGILVSLCYNFVFNMGVQSLIPNPGHKEPLAFQAAVNTGVIVFMAIFSPLLVALGSFISGGIFHLSLMLCSAARQPFETTYRTVCYCAGSTALFSLIPICGGYIGGIWSIVAMCIGMAKTHEITGGKAALAVLLPIGLCCAVFVVFLVVVFGAAIASFQSGHH
jgi:hypothetical protein